MWQGEHTVGQKQECRTEHTTKLEESVLLSPDYLRLGRKRKSDQMKVAPLPQQQQVEQPEQQQQQPQKTNSVDLDSSQVGEPAIAFCNNLAA